ncbi:hypothetical protein C1645_821176 [Glomus cerebriforme]|uniref:Uncharacterized protein n=1 Tax=Glomus cerebriforme TaxID=658196 RepID=A0A397T5B0_9GLOM|nr:hypothetical protein C1645_821176 [Glomus cerebriforme]
MNEAEMANVKIPIAFTFGTFETSKTSELSELLINKPKYEEYLKKKAIELEEDSEKFVTITKKDKLNSIVFQDRMKTNAQMCGYAKEQFLEKHNLSANSTLEQLSKHTSKLDALFPDWIVHRKKNLTIKERAKYCANNGDIIDIFANHLDLDSKNNNKK